MTVRVPAVGRLMSLMLDKDWPASGSLNFAAKTVFVSVMDSSSERSNFTAASDGASLPGANTMVTVAGAEEAPPLSVARTTKVLAPFSLAAGT